MALFGIQRSMEVYLDYNSTAPLDPAARQATVEALQADFANPASQHSPGRRARQKLAELRERLAMRLGSVQSPASRVIFTSGGTEANNLALFGLTGQASGSIVTSALEHPSVARAAKQLQGLGVEVRNWPVHSDGTVAVDRLPSLIDESTQLVCLILAHNETGVVQPVRRAVEICAAAKVPLHCDAAQGVGKCPVDFDALGVSSLSLGAHKFNGPRGIGALLVRSDVSLRPILHGGAQQFSLRPGTEDVALVAGMLAALDQWHAQGDDRRRTMLMLRNRFEQRLADKAPEAVVIGRDSARLPQTILVAFPGLDRQALFMAADLAGVAISIGSACASGSSEPSAALAAMGLDAPLRESAVRISFGFQTRADELDFAADELAKIAQNLREKSGSSGAPRPSRRT